MIRWIEFVVCSFKDIGSLSRTNAQLPWCIANLPTTNVPLPPFYTYFQWNTLIPRYQFLNETNEPPNLYDMWSTTNKINMAVAYGVVSTRFLKIQILNDCNLYSLDFHFILHNHCGLVKMFSEITRTQCEISKFQHRLPSQKHRHSADHVRSG